jgi:hypothetical protein
MDDEIRPIQPVAPASPVRSPTPVKDFPRRLGLRMLLLIQRMRNRVGRRRQGAEVVEEQTPAEPEETFTPDAEHHIDREA